jgi:hypothetical protein
MNVFFGLIPRQQHVGAMKLLRHRRHFTMPRGVNHVGSWTFFL